MSEEMKKKPEEATGEQVAQEPSAEVELSDQELDKAAGGRAVKQGGINT